MYCIILTFGNQFTVTWLNLWIKLYFGSWASTFPYVVSQSSCKFHFQYLFLCLVCFFRDPVCHCGGWMFVMFTYPDAWCFHPSPLQAYYTVFYSMTASFLRRFNPSGDWLCFLAVGILSRKLMDTHYRKVRDNLIQPQLQVETKKALDLYFLAESFPITGQATDWGLHFKLKTSIVVLQCYITAGMFTWCELDQLLYDKTQVQGFWV